MSSSQTTVRPDNVVPPPRIPDFELIRPIGQGGFGCVWLARNQMTGRLCAVKVIPLERAAGKRAAGREISSITRLEASVREEHPNLVRIHHVGRTADLLFYVMDPADDVTGEPASTVADYKPATLDNRLQAGFLSPGECSRFSRQLLGGLTWLHQEGMVHRDVKPSNCLFINGVLKLADFGLVTEADPDISRAGTLLYMPPDGRMGTRADVYAAGLVIYEMVTGLPAGRFPQLGDRAGAVIDHPVLSALNRVALRACQPEAGERFEDGSRMLAAVATSQPPAPARPPVRRRWFLALAALAATVILTTGLGLWWKSRGLTAAPGLSGDGASHVEVSFITRPFNATIHLDGNLLTERDGRPCLTPCTVRVPRGMHYTVFRLDGNRELDAGPIDYRVQREVEVSWPPRPSASGPPESPGA